MPTLADRLRAEPFELILSSGFFGFFAHAGVVHALEEAALTPALVGGSSAGALVAGLWGAGVPAAAIRDRLFALRRADFWDPDPLFGLAGARGFGLLRGDRFEQLLGEALDGVGVHRFAECRVPVRVVAFDVGARRTVTLGDGPLVPAIRASCSVPVMFQPAVIDARRLLDGGIADRAGISAASDGARVLYHHLPPNSPWRRFTPSQNRVPARPRLHLLHEPSLPRLSPFHLDRGPRAFELARSMVLRALAAPAGDAA
ncbi:MAG TPA: patatin-like phospholipase family protein [Polyangia bacterium]|nr:patatin-like phospholipase family protein [Polyangia bacterium]